MVIFIQFVRLVKKVVSMYDAMLIICYSISFSILFVDATGKPTSGSVINSPDAVFQNITEYCLKHVTFLESSEDLLKDTVEKTSSWKLACSILSLLSKLKSTVEQIEDEQTEEEKSIDVLSIQSQILVQRSVELVIGFGVVPYLLPGLGVPPKLRKMSPVVSHFILDAKVASPFEQFLRLAHTLEILLECSKHPTLNTLIAQKYTSDMLAGLLQICKVPILRPKNSQPDEKKPGALTLEQYEQVMEVRERLDKLMTDIFFVIVPKAALINSLFLVGSVEKPRWISATCNEMLYDIILSKNGLIIVSSTMVDVSGSCDTWKLLRILSGLMRNALKKKESPLDFQYLESIAEQCVQMVSQYHQQASPGTTFPTVPSGANLELMQIGIFCGVTLMDMDFEFGRRAFWNRLFCHVVHLDSCQTGEMEISSSFENVAMSIFYAELLLNLLKPMSAALPLKLLQPVWSIFVQIFVACEKYLKKPVQEPTLADSAKQLHRKLKDVLILLFEIYGSGAGESLVLPSSNGGDGSGVGVGRNDNTTAAATSTTVNLCDFIMTLLFNQDSHGVPTLNTFDLLSNLDNQADVQVVQTHQEIISPQSDYNEVYEKYLDSVCSCLAVEILKSERLKCFWPTLFRQLLSWGVVRQGEKKPGGIAAVKQKTFKSDALPTLLEGSGELVKVCLSDCQKFITFKLLGELGDEEQVLEQFGNNESMEETLAFLELLLNKFTAEVGTTVTESKEAFDTSQLIMYALGIIGALIDAAAASVAAMAATSPAAGGGNQSLQINKEINELWDHLEIFVPHLRKLSQCTTQQSLSRQGIPEMASGLLLSIGTRGENRKSKTEFPLKTRFQQALEDAASPMVHVRGHGILELRRLIEQRDREALENEVGLLKIFRENLSNDDSYVYLMCIQGMAALAVKFHKSVVPVLIKEYDFINYNDVAADDSEDGSSSSGSGPRGRGNEEKCRNMYEQMDCGERTETRMKVGEILVKVVQKLNEFAPSYRAPLTNVFFRLVRDEEPLIRASALANLGELCHLLKFSLGIVLTEVSREIRRSMNTGLIRIKM